MGKYTSILLVTKPGHAQAAALAQTMLQWLCFRKVQAAVHVANHDVQAFQAAISAIEAKAVIVLGGDGTFIGVARKLVSSGIAVLGINFGHLGFLTELCADEWEQALDKMLSGQMILARRMGLDWQVQRNGQAVVQGFAINDVVVGRGNLARVINMHLSIHEQDMYDPKLTHTTSLGLMRSDGLIVSTPLGSSAYSLSERGPLVHHDLSTILVTSIAPFLGSLPPLVLPVNSCVQIVPEKKGFSTELYLTIDGQDGFPLESGDIIRVSGVSDGLYMLIKQSGTYLKTLQNRGFIHE